MKEKNELEKILIDIKKKTSTAETLQKKADRNYAYFKNENYGDPNEKMRISQKSYQKAFEIAAKVLKIMQDNNIHDELLEKRNNDIVVKHKKVEQLRKNKK